MDGARGARHARVGAALGARRWLGLPLGIIGASLGVCGCERPPLRVPSSPHAEANQVQSAWVTSSGLSACVVTDRVWIESVPAHFALRLRNDTTDRLAVGLLDTVRVSSLGADGAWTAVDGGRNGTAPGTLVVRLAPGESFDVERPVRIVRDTDGRVEIIGSDGFGGSWALRGVAPGTLTLRMTIGVPAGAPVLHEPGAWMGVLVTEGVLVSITPASDGSTRGSG